MANVGQFLQSMQRETGDHPPEPLVSLDWLQHRYESVLSRAQFNFLISEATFNTVAEITTGTVTVTLGSATVTETTSNANGWTSAVEDRYYRSTGDTEFYLISTFGDANPDTLTLNRVYEEATATEKSYRIFQRFYSLASDVREVISMARIDNPVPMIESSQAELDYAFPHRSRLGNPTIYAPAGTDSSDNLQVELYPIPDEAHGILYRYVQETPSLTDADASLIPQVPFGLLKSGWMADYWSWRTAFDNAPANAANLSAQKEAEFEKRLAELLLKEAANIPPVKLRLSDRLIRHRVRRANKFGRRVVLESQDT